MRRFSEKALSIFVESVPKCLINKYFAGIVPIFMLHRLSNKDKGFEEEYINHVKWCLNYVRANNYIPVSLKDLLGTYASGRPIPPKTVVFTIDDGFYDQYDIGASLFSEFDVPLTCFVITDFLDEKLWPWDDQISYILNKTNCDFFDLNLPNNERLSFKHSPCRESINVNLLRENLKLQDQSQLYSWLKLFYGIAKVEVPAKIPEGYKPMSWSDAQRFIDSGHHIAPHTKTHRILSRLSDKESEIEILGSHIRVHEKLTGACDVFAYPTGRIEDYTKKNMSVIRKSSLIGAVATQPGYFSLNSDQCAIPRFSLPITKFDFIQYLSFFEELKNKIRS